MKKFYVLALSGSLSFAANSQLVVNDFESISLSAESYDNGSSGSGGFDQTEAFYENVYDTQWASWTGFSISNMTDVTTAGWGNQYSAYTGTGYNSSNYAVYFRQEKILFQGSSNGVELDSVKITNTTYAAISMRDGDAYSKQFGSPNDANGAPDGTNGEDFFKIWIIGEYQSGQKDSVEFYLADYRFADNNLDYIVEDWVNVDLTSFTSPVVSLSFRFESSDVGQWGINTPLYFAMDDLHFRTVAGVDENTLVADVYPNPVNDVLNVQGESGTLYLYDMSGKLLFTGEHKGSTKIDMNAFSAGVYQLQLVSSKGAYAQRIIK